MTENKPGEFPRVWILPAYVKKVAAWNRTGSHLATEVGAWSCNTGSGTKKDPDDIEYLSLKEAQAMVRDAKRDAYLQEVTYWLGELRAYVESGMLWEAELAMKNSRHYGDLAEREKSK